MKTYRSLTEALTDLKERGYTADFATDTVCLYCGELDIRLNPEEFRVDEAYRFEKDTDPGDCSILYAITSATGTKGILFDAYGDYALHLNFDEAAKLHYHQVAAPR